MDANVLIDSYTDDVARRLPGKVRNDVGLELRALLTAELTSVAENAGREPDREMALAVLRKFGRPADVAARYHRPGFHLIEPAHAPLFVKLAVIAIAIQWALTLPRVVTGTQTVGEWWVGWGLGALWWVGVLVAYFAGAAWIRRRSPVDPNTFARPWTHWIFWLPDVEDWRPGVSERVRRPPAITLIPLAAIVTIFFVAPSWFLGFLPGVDGSWASYDVEFRRWLLVPLLALMTTRLCLFAGVTVYERLRAPTEVLRYGVWICFVALLYWSLFGWDIFASAGVDAAFKVWLSVFLLVNTIQIVVRGRADLMRIRVPRALSGR